MCPCVKAMEWTGAFDQPRRGLDDRRCMGLQAGIIEQHQPVVGAEADHMAEGFDHRDTVGHFRQFTGDAVQQAGRLFVALVDDA